MKKLIMNSMLRVITGMNSGFFAVGLILFLACCSGPQIAGTEKITLASDSQSLHSVVVGEAATELTRGAAEDLATYLSQITGGKFLVTEGDGTEGIAVGSFKDFPKLRLDDLFDPEVLTRRDEHLLRTHDKGVYLVGATDLAAQHAVWGFLYKLGYRQFFPTDSWEFIPEEPNLSAELDAFERPDFYNRNGPRFAPTSDNELWLRWHDRNRITSSFMLNTGHSYNGIIERNKQDFDEHPEYLALVDGVRGGGRGDKFCISNDELRRLVIEDAKRRVENDPEATSISMDPSDGGSYCECESCAEMGSNSDQVIFLANEVAEAINNMGYGEKYVGIYAYASYSPPPNIDVHPNVIVSIATAFLRGGYTLEELIEGWSKRTNMIGIREYYDLFVWYQELPRRAPGGNVKHLVEKIPYYHKRGARFMNAESSDAWASSGLGFYLSAHMLWDVDAVNRVDEMIEDFLEKSFAEAKEPMRKFYHMIAEDYDTPRTQEDLLARMYGYIKEARELVEDPMVLTRLNELVLYTRYVELWFRFVNAEGETARDKAAQDAYRHAYRMKNTMMVHITGMYRYLRRPNVAVNIPQEADPGSLLVGQPLEDMEPWKSSREFTDDEIAQYIEDGVANFQKAEMEFEVVSYSEDMEPAAQALGLREVSTGDMGGGNSFRDRHKMFTWLLPNEQLTLDVAGGFMYQDRGNVRIMLYSPLEELVEPVDTDESVPPDGETYRVVLESPFNGQHELEWMDGGARTHLEWPEGQPMTARASMENPFRLGDNSQLYFYVPKGTRVVGGYTSRNALQIFDGDANSVLDLRNVEGGEGYFNVPVPQGQDGKLWELQGNNLTLMLMTVPPYLARNEKELMLPKEVIEADKLIN